MTPKIDGWTIVVRGSWNRMIFSPEWLQARGIIQDDEAVTLEVAANFAAPPRIGFRGINLRVDSQRLALGTDSPNNDRLADMEQVIRTVLNELPHTPVTAAGINFQWVEEQPPAAVLRCFDTADANALADAGLQIRQTSVVRRLDSGGQILNLNLRLGDGGEVSFDFNFHHEVTSATAARDAIVGAVLPSRDRALEILHSIYELEPVAQ